MTFLFFERNKTMSDIYQFKRIMKKDLDNTRMTTEERRLLFRLTQLEQSPKWQIIVYTALEACVPYSVHHFFNNLQSISNYLELKDLDIAHLNKHPVKDQMKMIKLILNKMEEKVKNKYHLTTEDIKYLNDCELGEKYIKILEQWKSNHIKGKQTIKDYMNFKKEISLKYVDYYGTVDINGISREKAQKLLLNLEQTFNWQAIIKAVYEVTLAPLPYGIDLFKENLDSIGKSLGCTKRLSRLNEYDINVQLKILLTLFNEMDGLAKAYEDLNPDEFKGVEMLNFSKKCEMTIELWKMRRIEKIKEDVEVALSKI